MASLARESCRFGLQILLQKGLARRIRQPRQSFAPKMESMGKWSLRPTNFNAKRPCSEDLSTSSELRSRNGEHGKLSHYYQKSKTQTKLKQAPMARCRVAKSPKIIQMSKNQKSSNGKEQGSRKSCSLKML